MAKNNIIETPSVNTIGKGTSIKGDIRSGGDFRIDGDLDGSIKSDGKIVVGATGTIKGEIVCENADISGKIDANLKVSQLLSLKAACDVRGDIITDKLAIEPGAKFSGSCSMESGVKKPSNYTAANEPAKKEQKVLS